MFFALGVEKITYVSYTHLVLNDYQIKEVNDTEKELVFKQILTEKS